MVSQFYYYFREINMFAFQFYTKNKKIEDVCDLELQQALELWDKYLDDFKNRFKNNEEPEMCIWSGELNDDYLIQLKYVNHHDCITLNNEVFVQLR